MDEDMWHSKSTQRNIERLKADGVHVMPVGFGELGSGLIGEGRMAEPEQIFNTVVAFLAYPEKPLKGLHAVVTAGPTYEPIDPVRFIGNHSSGRMGIAIADELALAGASVKLVLGPSSLIPLQQIAIYKVQSASEMFQVTVPLFENADIGVFAAAVSDFRPSLVYKEKWKKNVGTAAPEIELIENLDILKECGKNKKQGQTVVGFALETENEEANALKKLESKFASMIILNTLNDEGAGFASSTNKVTIFKEDGSREATPLQLKEEIAVHIVQAIIKYRNK
jgi:phosphopantothenoylcysteine decarboxylase/phosphopantothenate--cysteine ligase